MSRKGARFLMLLLDFYVPSYKTAWFKCIHIVILFTYVTQILILLL